MLAGERANQQYAYQEVIETHNRALKLLNQTDLPLSDLQRRQKMNCHIRLGQAYRRIGQIIECRDHLLAALNMFDRPIPATSGRLWIALATQFGLQLLHRLLPFLFLEKITESSRRADLIETSQMYLLLSELYFVANDELPSFYCTVRALNLAETTSPAPILSEAYAQMSLGAGLERQRSIARAYQKLAQRTMERLHDAPNKARIAFLRRFA